MKNKMKIFTVENTWLGGVNHGWGNGYVIIPKTYPLYEKSYDEIHDLIPELYVNGGLTFSDYLSSFKNSNVLSNRFKANKDSWVVGFDTCHCGDNLYNWTELDVINEAKSLKSQLKNFKIK